MLSETKPLSEEQAAVQQRLLDAAEKCFAQFGLTKTTMEDVAQSAGMSRATVYRYFKNRDELLLGVVEREANRTAVVLKKRLTSISDPGEYIIEGIVQSLVEIPKRPELSMLFGPEAVGLTSRLVLSSGRLAEIGLSLLLPVIEPAREKGVLNDQIDFHVMIEWIFRILSSYLTVPSSFAHSEDEMRELLRRMLLPALIK
jgi:AcrR family transcriptional regulator